MGFAGVLCADSRRFHVQGAMRGVIRVERTRVNSLETRQLVFGLKVLHVSQHIQMP